MNTLLFPTFISDGINLRFVFGVMAKSFCSAADSASSSIAVNVGVFWRVLMPLRTMRLKKLIFPSLSSLAVSRVRDWFQMIGITTQSIFAKMVDLISFWDSALSHFVYDSVYFFVLALNYDVAVFVATVSAAASSAKPIPAFGFRRILDLYSDKVRKVVDMHLLTLTLEGRLIND